MGSDHLCHNRIGSKIHTLIISLVMLSLLMGYVQATWSTSFISVNNMTVLGKTLSLSGDYVEISTNSQGLGTVTLSVRALASYYNILPDTSVNGTLQCYMNLTDPTGALLETSGQVGIHNYTLFGSGVYDYQFTCFFGDNKFTSDGIYNLTTTVRLIGVLPNHFQILKVFLVQIVLTTHYVDTSTILNDVWGGVGAFTMLLGIAFVASFGRQWSSMKIIFVGMFMILFGGIMAWVFLLGGS